MNDWYESLQRPALTPPNWVFGPVWITLYTMMGISLYLVWQKGPSKEKVRSALLAFFGQLVLNSIWSIIFFGLRAPFHAFIVIVLLWFVILITILKFYKVDKKAGLILIPYIVWVSVALVLNYYVWILN